MRCSAVEMGDDQVRGTGATEAAPGRVGLVDQMEDVVTATTQRDYVEPPLHAESVIAAVV